MISPKNKKVDIPIENGFVGMVDRGTFDEWLRQRAQAAGAIREVGNFSELKELDGLVEISYRVRGKAQIGDGELKKVYARSVIGADARERSRRRSAAKAVNRSYPTALNFDLSHFSISSSASMTLPIN